MAGVRRSVSSAPRDALVTSVCMNTQWLKWQRVAGGSRRCAKDAEIEGVGISLNIRLGSLGSVVSSPAGFRAEPQPKMYLVHFIYRRTSTRPSHCHSDFLVKKM